MVFWYSTREGKGLLNYSSSGAKTGTLTLRFLLLVTCSLDNICSHRPHNGVILFQLMNPGYIYVKQQSILIATQAFELKLQRNVGTELTMPSN